VNATAHIIICDTAWPSPSRRQQLFHGGRTTTPHVWKTLGSFLDATVGSSKSHRSSLCYSDHQHDRHHYEEEEAADSIAAAAADAAHQRSLSALDPRLSPGIIIVVIVIRLLVLVSKGRPQESSGPGHHGPHRPRSKKAQDLLQFLL
jgi:hypothetical protein